VSLYVYLRTPPLALGSHFLINTLEKGYEMNQCILRISLVS
jgi:hypothetical protein